jgi:hypothetical protein
MNDPRRWLDGSDLLSPDELRVLEAGLEAKVPKDMKAAVKAALLAQLPAPAPSPSLENVAAPEAAVAGPAVSSVVTATLGGFLKATGIGFALGVAATVSWGALQRGEEVDRGDARAGSPPALASASTPGVTNPSGTSSVSAPGPSSEARSPRPSRDVGTVLPREVNAREEGTSRGPLVGQAPSVSTFPEAPSTQQIVSSESNRLAHARALLRNKDSSAAFAALESLRRDHPRGLLVQERELLTIEALDAMGNEEAARTRAQDFLTRHPNSPHTAAARRVLERRPASSP